jgi:hypothetical protein
LERVDECPQGCGQSVASDQENWPGVSANTFVERRISIEKSLGCIWSARMTDWSRTDGCEVSLWAEVFGLYLERPHDRLVAHRWLRGGRFRYSDMKEAAAAADAYVI